MGTSEFAIPSLNILLENKYKLLGVITRPDRPRGRGRKVCSPPLKIFAENYGLPVYQPESTVELLNDVKKLKPTIIICVAYGQILPLPVLQTPPFGCVNMHPSLLPLYRGAAPIQRAIINGEEITGITTMFLSTEMDAGDIILQQEVEIDNEITFGVLSDILAAKGANLLLKTLDLIEKGKAPRLPQDHSKATYAPPIRPEEEKILWEKSAKELFNLIRGMNPKPGAYTLFNGNVLKVWGARLLDENGQEYPAGQIIEANQKAGIIVQAGKGQLLITEVQPAGRSRMSCSEFCRGYKVSTGLKLGE